MRLNEATLAACSRPVSRPDYARGDLRCGIVHLGVGAFHRAHQAVYIDDLLATQPDWAITGVSLRAPGTADALNPQQGLFTLLEKGPQKQSARVICSVLQVLVAPQQQRELLQALTDPAVRIVSLTITEKGYCHQPSSGQLDDQHIDIVHDVAAMQSSTYPRSAIGWLVMALRDRRQHDTGPFTVVSCDNLPSNGQLVRNVVLQFARLCDSDLADWIAACVSFPCTMVDRIVPATSDDDRAAVQALGGFEDAWPVVAEPFSQWVVEDDFCNGRPAFERVGVQLVDDVHAYELMKLRMLNGSHSTLAYLGFLAGHDSVSDAMRGPGFKSFLSQMMTSEIIPTLAMPDETDLPAYRDALLTRFENPALQHRTAQIAMDGSQKLPQRLLATIEDNLANNRPVDKLVLGVAGWVRYVSGRDEQGRAISVHDPMSAELEAAVVGDSASVVANVLQLRKIFPATLAENKRFSTQLADAIEQLSARGAAAVVASYAQG